jgi:hypothetical protein
MATDKKSFVLYADLIINIDHLTNEEKGILFNHLLEYVNDMNPVLTDRVVLSAWKFIQSQLKRDLRKFEDVKAKRSDAGKESARLRALNKEEQNPTKSTSVECVQQTLTNPTDNVNENVNVNNINIIYKENNFLEDWGKCRKEFIKQPTNIKKLDFQERISFADALKNYTDREVKDAMVCLFKQEVKNISAMFLRPKHFLESIDKYVSASTAKDYKLYGSIKKINSGAL